MEVKITISDTAGSEAPHVSVSGPGTDAGERSPGVGVLATGASASMPGINAGAAPLGLAATGTHAPLAFVESQAEESAQGQAPDQSAGAAPAL